MGVDVFWLQACGGGGGVQGLMREGGGVVMTLENVQFFTNNHMVYTHLYMCKPYHGKNMFLSLNPAFTSRPKLWISFTN